MSDYPDPDPFDPAAKHFEGCDYLAPRRCRECNTFHTLPTVDCVLFEEDVEITGEQPGWWMDKEGEQ